MRMTKDLKLDRRGLIRAGGAAVAAAALPLAGTAWAGGESDTRLYILGSRAGPVVGSATYQTSYAVVVGEEVYLIDCGYGATEQFVRAGLKLPDIRDIFITHHHPDHNIELGTLIYFAWYAGLDRPLGVYGPPPIEAMTESYLAAFKPDVDIWIDDIGHAPMAPVNVTELSQPQAVMDDGTVKVSCTVVNHPPVVPALGYRFDTPGRSIAFSGDTIPVPAMVELAHGADVLVHEAIYTDGRVTAKRPDSGDGRVTSGGTGSRIAGDAQRTFDHVIGSHTPVEEAARIAAEAGVKTLVLAHTVSLVPGVTDGMWIAAARKHFDGEVIFAHDLMVL